jgi:isopentenyl-diphosphate delta-isomerase
MALLMAYTVDYILFLTNDVTVKANPNEVRDYKYVSKEELKQMFEDTSKSLALQFN